MSLTALMHWFENFGFIWPWMIAFLPLPWLIRPFLKPAQQKQIPLLAPHLVSRLRVNQSVQPLQKPSADGLRLPLLFLALWLVLLLAAMRPVWFLTPTPFESTGRDMLLSVDLSGSMEKPDMLLNGRNVDRLVALKSVVDDFIVQRQGDRMGLIVFGTEAFMVSPLTYDLSAIQQLLQETQIGMAGNNTAIGDSIGLAIKHLQGVRNNKAVLVLLTDGSNNAGAVEPLDAAKKAAEVGLVIHTIAFGDVQAGGSRNRVFDIDTETLEAISALTGGESFVASQTQQLAEIYKRINEIESTQFTLNQFRARTELFSWPLGLALLLSFYLVWRSITPKPSKESA
ncbi:VWA domain-containing protein [Thiomicrospira microaerophila]|uniref:VWA domain-containing protein n=1 Tax=Thiomicrospira microaerophila TaxID=406020 RepID=UPI0005C8AA4E|nr:VWA domain-containing protein [Thiomicrospira microaerophila]